MEWWEQEKIKAEQEREFKAKYPNIGRTVRYKGEYGVVILASSFDKLDEGEEDWELVRWDTRKEWDVEDCLCGGNWMPDFVDEPYEFKWINRDGTLKN